MNSLLDAAARGSQRWRAIPTNRPVPAVVPTNGPVDPDALFRLYQSAGFYCNDWLSWSQDDRVLAANKVLGPRARDADVSSLILAMNNVCWTQTARMSGGVVTIRSQPYMPGVTIAAPARGLMGPVDWSSLWKGVAVGAGLVGVVWVGAHLMKKRGRRRRR